MRPVVDVELPDEDPEAVELVAAASPSAGAFSVDLDRLTVLDMMDLEDELGIGLAELKDALAKKDARLGRILAHMVWFEMRRADPSITLRQAAASVSLMALAGEDDPGKSAAGLTTSA